ncbi:RNA cap guanine-N2 methyltransferase-domain-containing protein [Cyathus striatus]|nr:RNA cap guanine-N2 methyltransferase-domain-containing protein [Cyathus striatus]
MGKRKGGGGLTGLSRFVLESFKASEPSSSNPTPEPSHTKAPEGIQAAVSRASEDGNPHKKRKTDESAAAVSAQQPWAYRWNEKYDATGLVPHYSDPSEVPEHLQKYFSQRTRFFSLYSELPGCLLDEEGWYSVTPELVANQIAERCRCDTILDAFCGVGGNAIAFAKTCQRVIALDTSPTRLALARHNAQIYGVADRIEFILADYLSFAKSYLSLPSSTFDNSSRKIDVVFLSPPWGGPSYLSGAPESRPSILHTFFDPPIHGAELFKLSRRITKNIAYYLPRNTRLDEIGALLDDALTARRSEPQASPKENVEVEEEWMGNKLKALTCYFGGLVDGQEHLF